MRPRSFDTARRAFESIYGKTRSITCSVSRVNYLTPSAFDALREEFVRERSLEPVRMGVEGACERLGIED